MKMWAVFDKDGEIYADACASEESAWVAAWRKNICVKADAGFTCSPVVVMREEVYSHVCKLVAHQASYTIVPTHLNEFLKAGG